MFSSTGGHEIAPDVHFSQEIKEKEIAPDGHSSHDQRSLHENPKQLKEISEKEQPLSTAPVSPWIKAIGDKDCKKLLQILKGHLNSKHGARDLHQLLEQTDSRGRSALHVAVMQGCCQLTEQVMELNCIHNLAMDKAKDGCSGQTAVQMSQFIHGEGSITRLLASTYKLELGWVADFQYDVCMLVGRENETESTEEKIRVSRTESRDLIFLDVEDRYEEVTEYYDWKNILGPQEKPGVTACAILSTILRGDFRLLLQKYKGLTVLHVAVCIGDLELVKAVLKAFGTKKEVRWVDSMHSALTLNDMLQQTVLGSTVSQVMPTVKIDLPNQTYSALELAESCHPKSEILQKIKQELDAINEKITVQPADQKEPILTNELKNILEGDDGVDSWSEEMEEEFKNDVDYNFEGDSRLPLLRFHYLCKARNARSVFKLYCMVVQRSLLTGLYVCLWNLQDAQGRTPLLTILDHIHNWRADYAAAYSQDIFKNLALRRCEMGGAYFKDTATSFLYKAMMKDYIQPDSTHLTYTMEVFKSLIKQIPLETWIDLLIWSIFCGHFKNFSSIRNFMNFKVLENKGLAKINESSCDWHHSPIFVAALMGNQAILQRLIQDDKIGLLKMCDVHSKTTLHYAAMAILPQFTSKRYMTKIGVSFADHCTARKKRIKENDGMTYVEKRACVNMLLRAGVDIWQQDDFTNIPDPALKPCDPNLKPGDPNLKLCDPSLKPGDPNTKSADEEFYDDEFNDRELHVYGGEEYNKYQDWWNEKLVQDTTDSKNSFNQASNALSVVGTLVAATSYVGPLQPPLSYVNGHVDTTQLLIRVFMASNSLAFYLAVASVMFAVVPSLPIPQEGVVEELRRAQHTVAVSLGLLLTSILCVITSFASASIIVIPNEHLFHPSDLLFSPTIIGIVLSAVAIYSFLSRLLRLVFYRSPVVRSVYEFNLIDSSKHHFRRLKNALVQGCSGVKGDEDQGSLHENPKQSEAHSEEKRERDGAEGETPDARGSLPKRISSSGRGDSEKISPDGHSAHDQPP